MIPDMKLLCENMLVPSASNWLDLLRAAQLLNSLRLELQVMAFLKGNFSVLQGLYQNTDLNNTGTDAAAGEGEGAKSKDDGNSYSIQYSNIADFQSEFPGLLEDLLESRKILFPLPPSQMMIKQTLQSNTVAADAIAAQKSPTFPIWALVVAAVSFFLYQHVSKIIALGPIIPIVNIACFFVLLAVGLKFFSL